MSNKRIHYAVEQVGLAVCGSNTFTALHGVQQLGINTKFNLEQFFQLSQLALYENAERIPDIECTLEKLLDGYCPIYLQATRGATAATLSGRSNVKTTLGLSVFSDDQDSASGTPIAQATMSGVYVSSVSYTFPVQGACTESVTLVGNSKVWSNSFTTTTFNNQDEPMAIAGSGGVNLREDVLFGSAGCLLPTDIPGISASGTNELSGENFAANIQSIRTSANLGREQLFQLGRKGAYHRYVTFPVEVTTEIEVLSISGDNITARDDQDNLTNQRIKLKTREGLVVDLGSKNKCASVTFGGANAGQNGGNATDTYTYTTFNDFTVQHPQDPTTALRP